MTARNKLSRSSDRPFIPESLECFPTSPDKFLPPDWNPRFLAFSCRSFVDPDFFPINVGPMCFGWNSRSFEAPCHFPPLSFADPEFFPAFFDAVPLCFEMPTECTSSLHEPSYRFPFGNLEFFSADSSCFELRTNWDSRLSEPSCSFPPLSFANSEFFPTVIDSSCFELWNS